MNHHEHRVDLGPASLLPLARAALLNWAPHELAGVSVAPARPVRIGAVVDLRLNPVWPTSPRRLRGRDLTVPVGSCVVTDLVDEDTRAGFTYRTLPGHLESGEETFHIEVTAEGRLSFLITAESTHDHPVLRALGPLAGAGQTMMTRRYAAGLQRLLGASST